MKTRLHPDSQACLAEHLQHMRAQPAAMPMLFMRARNTADGMIAGCMDGELELYYPCARVVDFAQSGRFLAFCRQNGLPLIKERWGTHLVYRVFLGADVEHAVALIAHCFQTVYDHTGPFALDLKGDGWQPGANTRLAASGLHSQA